MRATGIKLKQLNDFLQAYAGVDAESGDGDIVMQLEAKDGELTGYAKPLFRHVTFFSWKHDVEQQHDNPLKLVWEGLAGGDRTSVAQGKSVSVSVDLGGRRLITKKKHLRIRKTRKE